MFIVMLERAFRDPLRQERATSSRFGGHPFREGRSVRFPRMHLLDLPSHLALTVAQAPGALALLLVRDLLRKLAP
jgi:hypothetical protein